MEPRELPWIVLEALRPAGARSHRVLSSASRRARCAWPRTLVAIVLLASLGGGSIIWGQAATSLRGTVSMFASPSAAINDFYHPFPGQGNGSRNALRGDGYAGWDMALSKRWKMPFENHSLQFRWEVFNVPNLVRFNAQTTGSNLSPSLQQVPGAFGDYTGLLTQPRVMQFALRYEFYRFAVLMRAGRVTAGQFLESS